MACRVPRQQVLELHLDEAAAVAADERGHLNHHMGFFNQVRHHPHRLISRWWQRPRFARWASSHNACKGCTSSTPAAGVTGATRKLANAASCLDLEMVSKIGLITARYGCRAQNQPQRDGDTGSMSACTRPIDSSTSRLKK